MRTNTEKRGGSGHDPEDDSRMIAQDDGGIPHELSLRDETWETLVDSVLGGECTPFLGAGVAAPYLPRGSELAADLAKEFNYPLDDDTNLARVTQYIASLRQPSFVKRRVCKRLAEAQRQAVEALEGGPPPNHLMLAQLRLPVYVTTNYDDYLERAVLAVGPAKPTVEICRWNDRLARDLPKYRREAPTQAKPTIFHLHGHMDEPNSILITDDDYIDFAVSLAQRAVSKIDPVIPHFVRRALGNTNLLFVGYSLEDWNFRVLMRHIMKQQAVLPNEVYNSLSIQLSSNSMPAERRRLAEEFLEKYLKTSAAIDVYWGDAGPFLKELLHRLPPAPGMK
ncbi:SIR2-like protein [Pseudonocardia hierapolitana]|uniref:SIR2-like protein n=1 Tax=Pseudonocardia hierapolitana TaxID=1128676 RepID=A0A561SPX5_9PSEU|nr:SIR2 family protein [Pseudonocardia hierapolitana]TWF76903.1 SIR2-like protein [Pseudonocardia hierapolitana]